MQPGRAQCFVDCEIDRSHTAVRYTAVPTERLIKLPARFLGQSGKKAVSVAFERASMSLRTGDVAAATIWLRVVREIDRAIMAQQRTQ